jgi:hypothetical protein
MFAQLHTDIMHNLQFLMCWQLHKKMKNKIKQQHAWSSWHGLDAHGLSNNLKREVGLSKKFQWCYI